eukprot:COSAG06_NODE_471_length_15318_cov_24.861029_6_plen_111_part_00
MPDGKSFEQIEKEKKAAAAAAAEAEKKAEPLVLEEDDEFEEFEQEGALALAPSFLPRELAPRRAPVWYRRHSPPSLIHTFGALARAQTGRRRRRMRMTRNSGRTTGTMTT